MSSVFSVNSAWHSVRGRRRRRRCQKKKKKNKKSILVISSVKCLSDIQMEYLKLETGNRFQSFGSRVRLWSAVLGDTPRAFEEWAEEEKQVLRRTKWGTRGNAVMETEARESTKKKEWSGVICQWWPQEFKAKRVNWICHWWPLRKLFSTIIPPSRALACTSLLRLIMPSPWLLLCPVTLPSGSISHYLSCLPLKRSQ